MHAEGSRTQSFGLPIPLPPTIDEQRLDKSDKQRIAEAFHVTRWAPDIHLAPGYNIAPSTIQPIIRSSPEDGERDIVLMRGVRQAGLNEAAGAAD
jgi:hypothetical protein